MSSADSSYTGPERRKSQRRKRPERRTMIRFEPDKAPRRCGKDRRKGQGDIWARRDI